MSSFILLLTLTISFIAAAAGTPAAQEAAGAASELVTLACASAPNKDLCQQTINADNKTPKKDINDLAFITFEAASTKTLSNIEYITRTSDDSEADDSVHSALKQIFLDCEQQYEGAVDDVDNSVNYLASRSKEDDKQIDGLLQDAIAAIESCHNNVKAKAPKEDQLTKLNQELLDLLHNAVAVFHVIKQ